MGHGVLDDASHLNELPGRGIGPWRWWSRTKLRWILRSSAGGLKRVATGPVVSLFCCTNSAEPFGLLHSTHGVRHGVGQANARHRLTFSELVNAMLWRRRRTEGDFIAPATRHRRGPPSLLSCHNSRCSRDWSGRGKCSSLLC